MAKRKPRNRFRIPNASVRRELPIIDKSNKVRTMLCPFCPNPHPISVEKTAQCGTFLEVQAIQRIYKNVPCSLCGEKNDVLIRAGDGYVHTENCSPGKVLYSSPPKKSFIAAVFYNLLPEASHLLMARKFGKVPMKLFDKEKKPAGYTWQAVNLKKVADAKN